jgi:hypothetical protein
MVDVQKLQQRTARYEMADGLRDFQFAFWMLVIGFYTWVVWEAPAGWLRFVTDLREYGEVVVIVVTFILPIVIPALIAYGGQKLADEYLRRRWLWRESGFIKPRNQTLMPRTILLASAGIWAVVFGGGILLAHLTSEPLFVLRGLYVGIGIQAVYMYWVNAARFDMPRYRWVALAGLIGTGVIAILPVSVGTFGFLILAYWAVLLAISGGVGMAQAIREAPDAE